MHQQLIQQASTNVRGILNISIKYNPDQNKALVIFDTDNELTNILTQAYKNVLQDAEYIDFNTVSQEEIIAKFEELSPQDLVVLIQSGSFRLNKYRIRINLFNRGLKVIEHMHLYRNLPETWESYIDSLEYDTEWYGKMGPYLRQTLAQADALEVVSSDGETEVELKVQGGLEIPKLNTGDYTNMANTGGTFPIGEVFTEAKNLESLNGSFFVYAHADEKFEIIFPEVFRVDIQNGLVTGWSENASPEFVKVIQKIKEIERPIIREIGFGLNRAIDKQNPLRDITAYERVVGVHLSLGEKHNVYAKEGIQKQKTRFHVDLFVAAKMVSAGNQIIFQNDQYVN